MSELIGLFNLLAPFFGLIGLGFFCGKVVRQPEAGLAWMQFFLIYVALPCLFYRLIADKPLDELANWPFIAATTPDVLLVHHGLRDAVGRTRPGPRRKLLQRVGQGAITLDALPGLARLAPTAFDKILRRDFVGDLGARFGADAGWAP